LEDAQQLAATGLNSSAFDLQLLCAEELEMPDGEEARIQSEVNNGGINWARSLLILE
jgi:hypothetical protein